MSSLSTQPFPLSTLGLITDGPGAGEYVEIVAVDDLFPNYVIASYANTERAGAILDARMSTLDEVAGYLRDMGWTIDWS
jgi:hypothetical protein